MTQAPARRLFALSIGTGVSVLCLAAAARQPGRATDTPDGSPPVASELGSIGGAAPTDLGVSQDTPPEGGEPADEPGEPGDERTDQVLFDDLLENHWSEIFPDGDRNVGGPQFFKYIYERIATSHELFERYSRFYCGVSGAIVNPADHGRFEVVKVKDNDGRCVVGKYYRCCWPCACDIMKHARVEPATFRLPNDPSGREATYWVLTIGDPCHNCEESPCDDMPPEVTTYKCKDGVTSNGLRVRDGRLTSGAGRLVFAILHDAAPADETQHVVKRSLLKRCTARINATPEDLEVMGGMGNIFVDVALVNSDETLTNSLEDLCD